MQSDTIVVRSPVAGWVTEPPQGGMVLIRPFAGEPVRVPVDQLDSEAVRQVLSMDRPDG